MKNKEVREMVKKGYAKVAKGNSGCCSPSCCCGSSTAEVSEKISKGVGYTDVDLESVPNESNLGLGCGNPVALASLKKGDIVLDLGSGAGFDCFLAAKKVGSTGRVIGVDMTPEMVKKAQSNAKKGKYDNVEFRLGEIENLPVDSNSVDIIISNCVINLSPEKDKVFSEAFRVLKPGGRLMVSDLVLLKELPEKIKKSAAAYVGCISGAIQKNEYLSAIKNAGFKEITVIEETDYPIEIMANAATTQSAVLDLDISVEEAKNITKSLASIKVHAVKK